MTTDNTDQPATDPAQIAASIKGLHDAFIKGLTKDAGTPVDFGKDTREPEPTTKDPNAPLTIVEHLVHRIGTRGPRNWLGLSCVLDGQKILGKYHASAMSQAEADGFICSDGIPQLSNPEDLYRLDTEGILLAVKRGWDTWESPEEQERDDGFDSTADKPVPGSAYDYSCDCSVPDCPHHDEDSSYPGPDPCEDGKHIWTDGDDPESGPTAPHCANCLIDMPPVPAAEEPSQERVFHPDAILESGKTAHDLWTYLRRGGAGHKVPLRFQIAVDILELETLRAKPRKGVLTFARKAIAEFQAEESAPDVPARWLDPTPYAPDEPVAGFAAQAAEEPVIEVKPVEGDDEKAAKALPVIKPETVEPVPTLDGEPVTVPTIAQIQEVAQAILDAGECVRWPTAIANSQKLAKLVLALKVQKALKAPEKTKALKVTTRFETQFQFLKDGDIYQTRTGGWNLKTGRKTTIRIKKDGVVQRSHRKLEDYVYPTEDVPADVDAAFSAFLSS